MTNSERASYIRGLMDGLELDPNAKETKVLNAIVELLDDLCLSVEELDNDLDELSEQVDEIDYDLGELEEGSIVCPGCGETLEFDFDDDEEEPEAPTEE